MNSFVITKYLYKKILTFHLEVALAGEIIALPHHAVVAPRVARVGVLDGQGEGVVVVHEGELGSLVALLGGDS